jgi:hypothetical protein
MSISDRKQELKRRRHRRAKLAKWEKKLAKASVSEKQVLAHKIRNLTPGCDEIIARWGLEASDR